MNPAAPTGSRLMKAVRREPVETTPVWIMRQAGRYLPEYMAVRSRVASVLELCRRPDLAAEVTLCAQQVLGVDAAILFADLPPLLIPMGFELTYEPGPTIHNPFRLGDRVERVRAVESADEMGDVLETARLVRAGLPDDIPLIGFAGAPFTLASYAIEGGGSRDFQHTKTLMFADPGAWDALMQRVVESLIVYLRGQIAAGCQLVQLFDSWGGCLSPADYRQYVLPYSRAVIEATEQHAPVIHFLTGNPALLPLMREAGGQVIGVDWRVDLKDAWRTVGHDVAVQGNLDPVSLFADLDTLRARTQAVLDGAERRPGHIFNLGHGVMPGMKPENVKALVEMVHELGQR
ncbi:MAG: uroporphyrinogen decarboxylase [Planctomycetaceae bacterium]